MLPLESLLQLLRESLIALLANRSLVKLKELGFLCHFCVAQSTGEVMGAPGFVEGHYHITINNRVANKAQVAKEFVIVGLAVGQPFALVMTVAHERLLTLGTYEVLHVPVLAKGCHYTLLNGSPASTTYRNTHLVVAS